MISICKSWDVKEAENKEVNPEPSSVVNNNESKQENPVRSKELDRESPSQSHVVLIHPPNTDQTVEEQLRELLMLDLCESALLPWEIEFSYEVVERQDYEHRQHKSEVSPESSS